MTDTQRLEQPGRRQKCRATATNAPGWLDVTTYATCIGGTCIVNGSGEVHRVIVTNSSPLPYEILIRGTCMTGGLAYDGPDGPTREWEPNNVYLSGWRHGSPIRREVGEELRVVETHDDETIAVSVSWKCVSNVGRGSFDEPLIIQVDTHLAGGC